MAPKFRAPSAKLKTPINERLSSTATGSQDAFTITLPSAIRRIVLTGFMAAGKTTVGKLLAARLGWRFIDVDDQIETASGLTVAEIFQLRGEATFRTLERETIARLLSPESMNSTKPIDSAGSMQPTVLAVGGGAIEDDHTRRLLLTSDGTRLIYLDASLETALLRCGPAENSASIRPVLADRDHLEARYLRRLPLYRQSHYSIVVDDLNPHAAAEAILLQLRTPVQPQSL